MLDKLFGGDAFLASTHALDAYVLRHQAIANNMANVNTPGYKRQVVNFEDKLAGALSQRTTSTDGQSAVEKVTPSLSRTSGSMRQDGNNVDVEIENSELAINTLRFEAVSQQVSGYFHGLNSVINSK